MSQQIPLMSLENLSSEAEPKDRASTEESAGLYSRSGRTSTEFLAGPGAPVQYRVYKRRWAGLAGFVLLNSVATMAWPWFGPIEPAVVKEFGFTTTQINWLGNLPMCVFLPASIGVPILCKRWGIQRCCYLGCLMLLISAWVRFAGTAAGLSTEAAYALLMLAQAFVAIAQPFFQVLGPMYSETWFDLKSRTTATMLVAVSNPVGAAVGQLISPLPSTTRTSILVLAIASTAVIPFVFLIGDAPPTPPTYSASRESNSFGSLARALLGRHNKRLDGESSYMSIRERLDFLIILMTFGIFVGQSSAFGVLTGQIFVPYGYTDAQCGLFGSVLLLVGLVSSLVAAPVIDRVPALTHRLALISKVLVPAVGALWFVFTFAVKPHNTGGLFALVAVLGAVSVPSLPIALELACEVTRNADGSSALLWFASNVGGIFFILLLGALEAGDAATPPGNMHTALLVQGAIMLGTSLFQFFLRGKQTRRAMDEKMLAQVEVHDGEEGA